MSIDPKLLSMLVCPATKQPLQSADDQTLTKLNDQITKGTVRNLGDSSVKLPLASGLIRDDGKVLYPIKDGIPVLLEDEGITLK